MNHPERPAAGMPGVTVVGCGYTGRRLLNLCRDARRDVLGIVRSEESLALLRRAGAPGVVLDLDAPGGKLPSDWTEDRALIYMAPPPEAGDTDSRLRAFLARLHAAPRTLVYLSTTAVYGDTAGPRSMSPPPPPLRRRAAGGDWTPSAP
jgi:nucleoside-diphosphate-sugar epimerase